MEALLQLEAVQYALKSTSAISLLMKSAWRVHVSKFTHCSLDP